MCICGNEKDFNECCGPIISKETLPKSAEELMRSRYSAYVQANGEYLVYSAVKENQYQEDIALIEEFSNSVEWLKLDVLEVTPNTVEFKAYYRDKDGIQVLHEKSNFVQEDGVWKYKDGELYNTKIERNESCPCGSGKKYKKCCAK
ncbi:YchJ family protein [Sulfurimonas sp. C5]|uniref:YchJ family protein n=1 Tax=Sulfurimonas sp. C5 TaxID=3036947 RepID=UPI002454E55A|nr:YchJ family protein [Sulfurimonas sp. C5]MDH4944953.1 YchJ family protein [Sulfurimonas sp. C5]